MGIHEYDNNIRSDEEFIDGNLYLLVEGNHCRLLDGRRTTGIIEKYFEDSAMFRWRITKYEDKGKYWDLPAEDVKNFQFEKDSYKLSKSKFKEIEDKVKKYEEIFSIQMEKSVRDNTEEEIKKTKVNIIRWLEKNSVFLKNNDEINFLSREGSKLLSRDLKNYMKSIDLDKVEEITAETMVLNPDSGEWIKGMSIVLAEMGLVSFTGKRPRTNEIFKGIGNKKNRQKYLVNRLAFLRVYFNILNIKEVVLYRGMCNEKQWRKIPRTYLPCTFNLEVAKAFSDFDRESKYKISYLVKMTCPVEKLFMTYIETEAMNRQYKEAEALILYDEAIKF